MSKVVVVYYSRSGNTEAMAKTIAEAIGKEVHRACENCLSINPVDYKCFIRLLGW